jgi:hypothetical protein
MASTSMNDVSQAIWRDDIATPITGSRLADILLDPRETYSSPDRIACHINLSLHEKRLALWAWLRDLLAESRLGFGDESEVRAVLAELCALDPDAASVLRRSFVALGVAPVSS